MTETVKIVGLSVYDPRPDKTCPAFGGPPRRIERKGRRWAVDMWLSRPA